MAGTQDVITGKWTEIKGEIKKKWGQLVDSDLDATKGNFESLTGLLQQKLGHSKEDASKNLSEIAGRFADKANDKIDSAKDSLRNDQRNSNKPN